MRRVVATGGAGFIGSYLAKLLAGREYHVIILDDLLTSNKTNTEMLLEKCCLSIVE